MKAMVTLVRWKVRFARVLRQDVLRYGKPGAQAVRSMLVKAERVFCGLLPERLRAEYIWWQMSPRMRDDVLRYGKDGALALWARQLPPESPK